MHSMSALTAMCGPKIPLLLLQDRGDVKGEDREAGPSGRTNTLSFLDLYASLGRGMNNQRAVLLFYDLLHASPNFLSFVVKQK